jgi:hypothetical protein
LAVTFIESLIFAQLRELFNTTTPDAIAIVASLDHGHSNFSQAKKRRWVTIAISRMGSYHSASPHATRIAQFVRANVRRNSFV